MQFWVCCLSRDSVFPQSDPSSDTHKKWSNNNVSKTVFSGVHHLVIQIRVESLDGG
jgi:hypothetical protein